MELVIQGDCAGGPALELDHTMFSYAGKFRMTNTGKAVITEDGTVVGAISFSLDRTESERIWYRYITIRANRRKIGVGARLAKETADLLLGQWSEIRIAVNNQFAFHAMYKAGFGYTGDRTGLSELILERPNSRAPSGYHQGLQWFQSDSRSSAENEFIDSKLEHPPPALISTDSIRYAPSWKKEQASNQRVS